MLLQGEIDSVVLVGGGTRVPRVQETLLSVVDKWVNSGIPMTMLAFLPPFLFILFLFLIFPPRSELGKNLNTDEAAALGAVYQGASFTKLFRVKKFIVKDACTYPVQV